MLITLTQEEMDRSPGYAIGKAIGQKARGSGDPDNEFSLIYTSNKPDGKFDGTYTLEIPDGKITKVAVATILENPEQPPITVDAKQQRLEELEANIDNATLEDMRELYKLEHGL